MELSFLKRQAIFWAMPRLETYPYQRLPLEKEKLTKLGESTTYVSN